MSMELSARIGRVKPSATITVSMQAEALREAGRDIISLGAGEPDFPTPEHVVAAAIAAIHAGDTKYTAVDGTHGLKQAIATKLQRDNGLDYAAGEILASCGAKHAIFNCLLALVGPGDEVVIPAPYWVSYPDMVRLADAAPVTASAEASAGYRITASQLEAAFGPRTRALILNSPCNPTGMAHRRAELEAIGELVRRHPRVVVISDEIYESIYWGDEPLLNLAQACPDLRNRIVLVNGVSKAYAMTGWRIGYAAGAEALIAAMRKIQGQSTSNPCSVSQAAAIAALEGDQGCVAAMTRVYRQRHDRLATALNELPGVRCPRGEGTFYLLPDFSAALAARGLADDVALAGELLDKVGVALVPGSAFGAPGCLRVSYSTSDENLEEALQRLRDYLYRSP